ncbi:hypothetical protein [Parasitella parasitica]|uniref:BHLH domain-containing protein n=1 Tax=Parasitella parasitica TaxID=35722 RepID=A0A0B7NC87_9FUNG|nr:hypothetical protein [Parasitella parasitica]
MSEHYHYQQQQHPIHNGTMLNQQPILHQPPIVYGNYRMYNQHQLQYYHPLYQCLPPPPPPHHHHQQQQQQKQSTSSSPISTVSPRESPCTPPNINNNNSKHNIYVPQGTTPSSLMVNPLVPPSPSHHQPLFMDKAVKSTEERVKETIARANAIPMGFYQTEFLEYSNPSSQQMSRKRKRRTATVSDDDDDTEQEYGNDSRKKRFDKGGGGSDELSSDELRRQIHIQSEQKRRAQIKDGFDELRNHLPGCSHKKLSKAALLTRTVQQLEHMKKMQNELLAEIERLVKENSSLKKSATTSYYSST